ncbi:MAG: helix-turn-helix domain-containing protein [Victivallaceae bacterium]
MDHKEELELFQRGCKLACHLYDCHICVHDFSGQIVENVVELPIYHLNPFCVIFKHMDKNQDRRCVQFDCAAVAGHLARKPVAFWKQCHCGIVEAVIPVFMNERNIGVMFIGPFKRNIGMVMPKGSLVAPVLGRSEKIVKLVDGLRELSATDFSGILTMGALLAGQLEKALQKAVASETRMTDRKQQIEDFFNQKFHLNIALSDLAERLLLSESRTFQLLKKYFGQGFSEILLSKRLNRAEKLLEMSMFSIRQVAAKAGFQHGEYFCRVFKRRHGVSPRDYRKQVNHANEVCGEDK